MAAQLKEALRIIRRKQVEELTGLPKSSLYLAIKNGTFPPQIKLGKRRVGWSLSAVSNWIAARIEESSPAMPPSINQDEGK